MWVPVTLATLVLALTTVFFGPLNVYYRNYNEYTAQFWAVFHSTGILTLGTWVSLLVGVIIVMGIGRLLFRRPLAALARYGALITGVVAALFWLQGNILAIDYGVMNGRPVDWGQFQIPVVINALVWLTLLVCAWLARRRLLNVVVPVMVILLVVQTVNLIEQYRTQPKLASFKTHVADYTNFQHFSPKQNVIIILLDTFQSDVFEESLLKDPSLKANFTGFTYYRNTAGGFPTTYTSVPLIMTGQYFLNLQPIQDFIQAAYLKSSLPKDLQDRGYAVSIPCNQLMYCDPQISRAFDTIKPAQWLEKKVLSTYYKPTVVRYIPGIVYELYQNHKTAINASLNRDLVPPDSQPAEFAYDQQLLSGIVSGATVSAATPTFKYYHFTAPHPPFYMDAQGAYDPQAYDRQGQINHSTGALKLAIAVLNKFKALEVYDNSLILIMADHGYGPLGYRPVVDQTHPEIVSNPVIGAALPLLLIKPIGAKGSLITDDAAVSYSTLSTDIINYLDAYRQNTKTLFTPTTTPVRKFYFYTWEDNWSSLYMPPMTEYTITGYVRDQTAWKKPGVIYRGR